MRYVIKEAVVLTIALMLSSLTMAQGQDSSTWARDQQVIAAMLTGVYSNANQAYFDKREKIKNPHARRSISITSDKSVLSGLLSLMNTSSSLHHLLSK